MSPRRRPVRRPDQHQEGPQVAAAAAAAAVSRGHQANAAATIDRPVQGELFCPPCCGSGVTTVETVNYDGDPVLVPAVCPACRPRHRG
jgi:hypothetical protein